MAHSLAVLWSQLIFLYIIGQSRSEQTFVNIAALGDLRHVKTVCCNNYPNCILRIRSLRRRSFGAFAMEPFESHNV